MGTGPHNMMSVGLFSILSTAVFSTELAISTKPNQPSLPCRHPGSIDNGLTDWNGTGDVARFACYQGFYLVGPPKVKCRYGQWYSDAPADRPTCKPVVCSHPSIAYGSLLTGETLRYRAGESAQVVCQDGFQLRQLNNKIVCREDGSWTADLGADFPHCQEKGCLYDENTVEQPENGSVEVSHGGGTKGSHNGIYKPGSVLKYSCSPGWVVVPVTSFRRVCRKGRWDGQPANCVKKSPTVTRKGSCSPPPLITNGYFLSERYSGEKPYVLPVQSHLNRQFDIGAIARYHCNDGYTLLRLFGQDIYRCTAGGTWSPKQPPVCISKNSNLEPLDGMMCGAPEDVAYASYRAVEGVVTPNGAMHGTILEYTCNIGYRDSILPCIPSRRTCHAGLWVGPLPSCAPFEFCPLVPKIQNGYVASPRQGTFQLHSIVKYGCDRGFWMAGVDTIQCTATGCWEPNALPRCIDENLLNTWSEESSSVSLVAVLVSVCAATLVISAIMAVCGVMACRRKRTPPPAAPAHWSTHVTVTPECRPRTEALANTQNHPPRQDNGDRVALIAFAEGIQEHVVLPSYEEALREGVVQPRGRVLTSQAQAQAQAQAYRQHPAHRRTRHATHAQDHHQHQVNGGYAHNSQGHRGRRRHDPDSISHHSVGWPARQHSGSTSQSASLRSGSVQSVETVGASEATATTETSSASQTPSCRALAGSLASFDTSSIINTEGVPLLEENELETEGSNSVSEHGDTVSAYSETSTKSR